MKNLVPWLKSNWAILVLGLVAIAALPTLWYFSNSWNKKLIDGLQNTVNTDYKTVTSSKNNYFLKGLTDEKLLDRNTDYNQNLITAYEEIGKQLAEQSGKVGSTALAFNRGSGANEKKLLIDGLFPEPSRMEEALKPNQFDAAYIKRHQDMLSIIHAGMPPLPTELAEQLSQMLRQRAEQYTQEHGSGEMDAAARKALAEELLNFRLSRYQARAREIQVYADASVFFGTPVPGFGQEKPMPIGARLAQCWDLQQRLWMHQDLLHAIAQANGDSGGAGVPGSIVKRILQVKADDLTFNRNTDGTPTAAAYEAGADKAPIDFTRSITGRFSGPGSGNKWYDVRNMTVEMIVDSKRLPKFVDALATINFMTLISTQIDKVQPTDDLAQGFFYGEENVVKATLVIETVWFRELYRNPAYKPDDNNKTDSWKQWYIPKDLQAAMAMLEGVQVETPQAAPPQRPVRPPPGGAGGPGGAPKRGGNEGEDIPRPRRGRGGD